MFPELIKIPAFGPFAETQSVHSYGVFIAAGFVMASMLIAREAKRMGEPRPHEFTDLAFYNLLVGLVGSRLLFIVVNWSHYAKNPLELLFVWKGGLVFYGGFLAALGYSVFWCRRHGHSFWKVADLLIPALAFNHAWGRLGCFAAGCCFGAPTRAPLGVTFPLSSPAQQTQHAQHLIGIADWPLPVHPTQLYEATGEVLLFMLLVWFRPRKRFEGQLLLLWLGLYPVLRSVVEALRGDIERGFLGPLSVSQWVSIAVAGLAVTLFFRIRPTQGASSHAS